MIDQARMRKIDRVLERRTLNDREMRIMHVLQKRLMVCIIILGAAGATDQSSLTVPAPIIKVGDTWVFDETDETGTSGFTRMRLNVMVERVSDDTMLVGYKQDGSPGGYEDHQSGKDWSLRIVANGAEVTTARPFYFPMRPGQSWMVDFNNSARFGTQISLHVHRTYKVAGWEDITVPAGTFHALKIEATGVDQGVHEVPQAAVSGIAASTSGTSGSIRTQRGGFITITQRHYSEIYYVPKVKNFVKITEEKYNESDVRVYREIQTLVAYTPVS